MSTDLLNTLVTGAIWRAEQLEEQGVGSVPLAWAEVSSLEEKLATALPASQPEGRIARRGAVRAALRAGNFSRAQALTERFLAEKEATQTLRAALRQLLEEDASALAGRFHHATKTVNEARSLARWLQEGGAFGLAA
ncbi:MAG TPA: hypothetical protein VGS22_03725 [Thermoanaerobaculia bacterium]|jgi:hypothetical protein|nr:hypothetical protein [Thermoanaerobaculia bacterium]